MNQEDQELIMHFVSTRGRAPDMRELMMMQEARASVALDRRDDGESETVAMPEGAYTARGPIGGGPVEKVHQTSPEEEWAKAEVKRLQNLLTLAIEAVETAWDEGAAAGKKWKGKKGLPVNPYRVADGEEDDDA